MLRQKLFKDFLKSKNNLTIRDQLIEIHLPLVKKIVKQFKYFPKALQREDLYQEGILGLIKALNNYQDFSFNFIVYATPTIKGKITELIRGLQTTSTSREVFRKENQVSNIPFEETQLQTININNLNPHQIWLTQVNHELFIEKIKSNLNKQEFEIIRLSFGIPLKIQNQYPQIEYSNKDIGKMLNLSATQVKFIKTKAINKLKKIIKRK
ncbi:sigma-70 family RNA polymerase sigma factor [Paulownia witches'-broom phytoplasma]|uniref:Sigma-70 family RNA polymerase sigma factor n=1 Tax=Paulownia witches'-broom phytoplasma TaxID=39647 RepID=A0ABX8TN31_9MOLU|nr:sigma-70 family RNA polymerase sigma factor [Paulownia witches'-broom phytoplasma]QYC30833.1 sigma-70 family RNA polymerase sigma factor [Paulownia witches'-broom phytoplasma]GLH60544.1 RNA polymerase sigma factor [Paulownia witches'-broom phytoplasma]GLH60924.1 RNA polymerase sigma factor [Paulownia witches'-broom phytoplasma]